MDEQTVLWKAGSSHLDAAFSKHFHARNNTLQFNSNSGAGIRGLRRGMATLPQGNQELIVVRDKSWKTPGKLGVSKSMEYNIHRLA